MRLKTMMAAALFAAGGMGGSAVAQQGGSAETVFDQLGDAGNPLDVTAPDLLGPDGEIAAHFTQYGDGVSPAVGWSAGPDGTVSYVLLLQDPIAARSLVVLHWAVYDIPAGTLAVPEGIPQGAEIAGIPGARQFARSATSIGYSGPRPPAGDPPHSYTFQVFALDTTLDLAAGADLPALVAAMDGHVLAAGELVAPYAAPAK